MTSLFTPPSLNRLQRLRARRIDPLLATQRLNEVYERVQEGDATRYLIGAMQPIDPDYTQNTYVEANRVRDQLRAGYPAAGVDASFDYQGSVTNDTHILAHSDIDLLTVNEKFVFNETRTGGAPYGGNVTQEMLLLRNTSTRILREKFPAATIDDSGDKAVRVSGGSLRRKIDLVPCSWWNTNDYQRTGDKVFRGIKVFDRGTHTWTENKPFLHNARIDTKDRQVGGSLRKVIRLLKSLKYDANESAGHEKVKISSYDIAALAYTMDVGELAVARDQDLKLAQVTHAYLTRLETYEYLRAPLRVPNDTRLIFCSEGATVEGLQQLNRELRLLLTEIEQDLARSFRRLAEARIPY